MNTSVLSWWDLGPLKVREKINQRIMSIETLVIPVKESVDKVIEREDRMTPIRLYIPNTFSSLPIILLIHGGAWVAGNLDTHDNLARYLCAETPALVISVGYLNSPEGKFPMALEQCYDALNWIVEHANEYSADSAKIAIVGDSAGGNMSTALCLMIRDRKGPQLNLQVLINPAPDLSCSGIFERQNDASDYLRWQALQYLSDVTQATHPYVSPMLAADLKYLPKAVILLAEKDELYEDGLKYAKKLQSAGVSTSIYCQKGIGHLAGNGARASLRARESLNVAVNELKKVFF